MRSSRRLWLFLLVAFAPIPARSAEPDIAGVLQKYVDNHTLAGAVTVVATKDKLLHLEAVGFADIAAKQAMRTDNLFWIASMSKPITGTALMILVDEGKVNIDDPVEKYLPEFKGVMAIAEQDANHVLLKKPLQPMTVKHVLSHTSGMRFSSPMEKPTLDTLTLRDSVRSHALQPLQWEPGSKYQYSNAGINTAARIIEVVSGVPYEEFMQKRLFDPLKMTDTTFWPNAEQVSRLAKPYKPNADKTNLEVTTIGQLTYPLTDRKRTPMPAGGLFSTGKDVARFCQMVLNGGELDGKRYVSEASVKQMTSKQTGDAIKEGYGLGWSTNSSSYGHGGALATNMTIDPKRGLITVWMVQHAGFPGDGNQSHGAFQKAAATFAPVR